MRRALLPIVAVLALPSVALAEGTPPPTTTTPQPPASAPETTPDAAPQPPEKPHLAVRHVTRAHGHANVLPGQRFVVKGRVARFEPGQHVVVRVFRGGEKIQARELRVKPARKDGAGRFRKVVASGKAGILRIQAGRSKVHVKVLRPKAEPGDHGLVVRMLQRMLAREHYAVPRNGRFDGATARALIAFRKVNHMSRVGTANAAIFHKLVHHRGAFKPRYRSHGRHVEGDLGRQVLALIDEGGRVHRVYTMSSGKPSTPTVLGHYRVYRKDPGYNSEAMYFSSYFIRGYAVHGYHDVPTYAASHGCLRIPIPDAVSVYNWIHMGTPVDVYAS